MIPLIVIKLNLLVSVVVPTKNSSKTLVSCIQSIQKQSYPNIETITVTINSSVLGCNDEEIIKET